MSDPFDGRFYVADTSAWLRAGHPAVTEGWNAALDRRQIMATPILAFEVLRTARDRQEFQAIEGRLSLLREIRLTHEVIGASRAALREMALVAQHRLPFQDLLVAAAAQARGVGVLHYDGHFDRLARFLSFESRWIAPAGSL